MNPERLRQTLSEVQVNSRSIDSAFEQIMPHTQFSNFSRLIIDRELKNNDLEYNTTEDYLRKARYELLEALDAVMHREYLEKENPDDPDRNLELNTYQIDLVDGFGYALMYFILASAKEGLGLEDLIHVAYERH